VRSWEEGKSLVFDDSHLHEAWNDSDSYRVVLFVDLLRPVIFPLSLVNRAVVWITAHMPSITEPMDRVKKSAHATRNAAQAKQ
jgi:beta-hydroxylase